MLEVAFHDPVLTEPPLKGFLSATGPLLHLLATVISFRCVVKLTTEAA